MGAIRVLINNSVKKKFYKKKKNNRCFDNFFISNKDNVKILQKWHSLIP